MKSRKYRRGGSKRRFAALFRDRKPANFVFSKSKGRKLMTPKQMRKILTRHMSKIADPDFQENEHVMVRRGVLHQWIPAKVISSSPVKVMLAHSSMEYCFPHIKPLNGHAVFVQECPARESSEIDEVGEFSIGQEVLFQEDEDYDAEEGIVSLIQGNEISVKKVNPALDYKLLDNMSHPYHKGDEVSVEGDRRAIFVKYLQNPTYAEAKLLGESFLPYSVQKKDGGPVYLNPKK